MENTLVMLAFMTSGWAVIQIFVQYACFSPDFYSSESAKAGINTCTVSERISQRFWIWIRTIGGSTSRAYTLLISQKILSMVPFLKALQVAAHYFWVADIRISL